MKIEEIKLIGIKPYALYDFPKYFLEYDNETHEQVFYNPSSDYGYWKLDSALDYTSYLNSAGNMEEWGADRNKFLLFYDLNAPEQWGKEVSYLLFRKENNATLEELVNEHLRIFSSKGIMRIEETKELVNCSYEVKNYNARRVLDSFMWKKQRELRDSIEQYKRLKELEEEEKLAEEEWKFKSNSSDKVYQVKWIKQNGGNILSCNCPSWVFNQRKNRTCKHTDIVGDMLKETQKVLVV